MAQVTQPAWALSAAEPWERTLSGWAGLTGDRFRSMASAPGLWPEGAMLSASQEMQERTTCRTKFYQRQVRPFEKGLRPCGGREGELLRPSRQSVKGFSTAQSAPRQRLALLLPDSSECPLLNTY